MERSDGGRGRDASGEAAQAADGGPTGQGGELAGGPPPSGPHRSPRTR